MGISKHSPGKSSSLADAVLFAELPDIERLVRAGAKVNARDKEGFTALMLAITRDSLKIVNYLIKKGSKVNLATKTGLTALMLAAQGGHAAIAKELIRAGADVNAVDNEGLGALAWAASRGDFPETIALLATLGADYNKPDIHGMTPLIRAAFMGHAGTASTLLTVGADETRRFHGKTAYELASEKGHKEVCRMMTIVLKNRPKDLFGANR